MSAAKTKKIVQAYFKAFNAQDVDGMLGCLGANFVHDVSQGASRRGKAKFAAFLAHMNSSYREQLSNIDIMTNADGSRAAAVFDLKGKYLKTDPGLPEAKGQTYKLKVSSVFEISRGKIVRVSTHYNMNEWKKQILR
jgi:steroid delta-isomerase-like uncharacterized protein